MPNANNSTAYKIGNMDGAPNNEAQPDGAQPDGAQPDDAPNNNNMDNLLTIAQDALQILFTPPQDANTNDLTGAGEQQFQRAIDNGINYESLMQTARQLASARFPVEAPEVGARRKQVDIVMDQATAQAETLLQKIKDKKVSVVEYKFDTTAEAWSESARIPIRPGMAIPTGPEEATFLPRMLLDCAHNTHGRSGECVVMDGHNVTHNQTSSFTTVVNNLPGGIFTITTSPNTTVQASIDPLFEPNKQLQYVNWSRWPTPIIRTWRLNNGLRSMWGAGQNFDWVPSFALCSTPGYISGDWKFEMLPSWFSIMQRIGLPRWINSYHLVYWYGHGGNGLNYMAWYQKLFGRYCIMPGRFVHPRYAILNPHWFDKTMFYPHPVSMNWVRHYFANMANALGRRASLLYQYVRDRIQFILNPPVGDITEEGEFSYFNTDVITGLLGHLFKTDRRLYHNMFSNGGCNGHWNTGDAMMHVVRNRDIKMHFWTGFDDNHRGVAHVIKSKYPQPSFARFHVIYGKTIETLFSDMIFIKLWDSYRPLINPVAYKLIINKEDVERSAKRQKLEA